MFLRFLCTALPDHRRVVKAHRRVVAAFDKLLEFVLGVWNVLISGAAMMIVGGEERGPRTPQVRQW